MVSGFAAGSDEIELGVLLSDEGSRSLCEVIVAIFICQALSDES